MEKGPSMTANNVEYLILNREQCYDLRFPELSLSQAAQGAQILTYPSAFTFATGSAHWELLLRARAVETQCFVVAAAQTGAHNKKRSSWGHAMVCLLERVFKPYAIQLYLNFSE